MRIKVLDLDKPTRNGRIYPKDVVEKALSHKELKEQLKKKSLPVLSTLFELESNIITTNSICGTVNNIEIIDNELYADIEIIDTTTANDIKKLIDSGANYYFYTCGNGQLREGNIVDDYQLTAIGIAVREKEGK